jgi:hypothetical protein
MPKYLITIIVIFLVLDDYELIHLPAMTILFLKAYLDIIKPRKRYNCVTEDKNMTLSIENVKLVCGFACSFANVVGKSYEDKKIDLKDLPLLMEVFSSIKDLMEVDFKAVWPEVKDMDVEEYKILVDFFKAKFDLPQDGIEEKVEKILEYSKSLYGLVLALLQLLNKPKA